MIDAISARSGKAFLIRPSRGTHQSSVLSEMSSQFHEEWSAAPGRLRIDRYGESASARMNLVFGPSTLTTGCRPIVFVTTPPQPASNARMMFDSYSVGGADERRNGLSKRMPVKVVFRSMLMCAVTAALPNVMRQCIERISMSGLAVCVEMRLAHWGMSRLSPNCRLDEAERLIRGHEHQLGIVEPERLQIREQMMTIRHGQRD